MGRDDCNHGDGASTNKDQYSRLEGTRNAAARNHKRALSSSSRQAEAERGKKEGSPSSWDPNLLNRIRICRVSSIRDLWWDLLVLAGKPPHEQPARAIIVEDLDRIMGLPAVGDCLSNHRNKNSSYRNNNRGGDGGNKRNYNNIVATMLKTLAIAADTAIAIENNQQKYSPLSSSLSCLSLLVTLSTTEQQGHRRDRSAMTNDTSNSTGAVSDVLLAASCIDTVVTLQPRQQQRGVNYSVAFGQHKNNTNGEENDCGLKKPTSSRISTRNKNNCKDNNNESTRRNKNNCNKQGNSNKSNDNDDNGDENISVHSLWQAEIQERSSDQGDGIYNGNNCASGVSLIDYAFVESVPVENDNDAMGNYCGDHRELRWKHRAIVS
mmetsp:Transcript_16886/g.36860  ORF Transcript_16886/g.36860 Transcript_16886/m.36860 type:complete len:379 (-) Transcript_16886:37-1173(-)